MTETTLTPISNFLTYFPEFDRGRPIAGGQVYIGEPDFDPEVVANQKDVTLIQENGDTVAATQPVILSAGGVPTYNGSPARMQFTGNYSLKVLSAQGAQIYYIPNYEVVNQGINSLVPSSAAVAAGESVITVPTYVPNVNTSVYFLNSNVAVVGVDIEETDSTTLTLTSAVETDSTLYIYRFNSGTINTAAASNVSDSTRNQSAQVTLDGAATIAAMEAVTPSDGTVWRLNQDGRAGTFKFSTANLATEVTADTQQGIYIAPTSDATGASGAWVRQYGQAVDSSPQVRLSWFGGFADGSTDSTSAFAVAWAFSDNPILDDGEYLVAELDLPQNAKILGNSRASTRIIVTGDGGAAAAAIGANGGVKCFNGFNEIRDVTLSYNNPDLQCLLNISAANLGRIHVENLDLFIESSVADTDVDCLAVFLANLTEFTWVNGQIGILPNFKQDMQIRGWFNGCSIKGVTFRPHAEDIPNSVFHSINPLLDINASTQGSVIDNCTFEQGPNGVKCVGQGAISFDTCYYGDGTAAAGFWLPSTAYSQGDFVYPSDSVTGDTTASNADITSTSSTTDLYVGQKLVVIGAGAAGADLETRISSISGATVTMEDNASTTTSGTGVYFGDYDEHGYMVTVAGTSAASAPTFPTTSGDTVASGTVTLKEYGPCAWVDMSTTGGLTGKNSASFKESLFSAQVVGFCARRTGPTPGAIKITGGYFVDMDIFGYFNGIGCSVIKGTAIRDYHDAGFIFNGSGGACRNNEVGPMYQINNLPADVVISTNNNNMGGLSIGAHSVTGIGKDKFARLGMLNPNPELALSGYISLDDGTTAPGADAKNARIYVDSADGDLKIVFSDGTVKTIVVDT